MERETRIELATNSLEGCDSTIELLPHPGTLLFYALPVLTVNAYGLARVANHPESELLA